MKHLTRLLMILTLAFTACSEDNDGKNASKDKFCHEDPSACESSGDREVVQMEMKISESTLLNDPVSMAFGPYVKTEESFVSLSPVLGPPRVAYLAGSLVNETCWAYDATNPVGGARCLTDYSSSIDPGTGTLYAEFPNKAIGFIYTLFVNGNDQVLTNNITAVVVGSPPAVALSTVCVYPRGTALNYYRGAYMTFAPQRNAAGAPFIENYGGTDGGACGYNRYRVEFDIANTVTHPVNAATSVIREMSYSAQPGATPAVITRPITTAVSATTTATSKLDTVFSVPASSATTNSHFAFWYRPTVYVGNPRPNNQWMVARNVTIKVFSLTGAFICQTTLRHLINLDTSGVAGNAYYAYEILGLVPQTPGVCALQGADNRTLTIGAP